MIFFVRSADEKDLAAVSALLGETWHATYDGLLGAELVSRITAEWHSVPALKARLAMPMSEFVVADSGREIAGMAFAGMVPGTPGLAELRQLYVRPSFQGQGVGRDLFAEVETCFPEARRMRLEVEPRNERAIRFYERLGFIDVGESEVPPEWLGLLAHRVMEKPLEF